MKNQITKLLKTIPILLVLFTLSSFYYQSQTRDLGTTLVNSQNIFVQKKNPVDFLLAFNKGDEVTLLHQKNNGSKSKGELKDLTITLKNFSNGKLEKITLQKHKFTAPSTGNYQLTFETSKRIRLNVKVEKSPNIEGASNETVELFTLKNLLVGVTILGKNTPASVPKFRVKLKPDEQLIINSKDDDSGILKYRVDGRDYRMGEAVTIQEDRDYAFVELFINIDKEDVMGGWKNFFTDTKEKLISDLVFSVKVPYIPEVVVKAKEDGSVGDVVENPTISESDMQRSAFLELLKGQQSGTEGMISDFGNMNSEMIEILQLAFRKDTILKVSSKLPQKETLVVAAQEDLLNSSKVCQLIKLTGSGSYWTFYIGVGKDVEKIYLKKDNDIYKQQHEYLGKLYAEAIKDQFFLKKGTRVDAFATMFPREREFPENIFEDVEFAIVNDENKKKFLNNLPFDSFLRAKNKNSIYNWMPLNENSEALHLCLCNDNKVTPLEVFFHYQEITLEEEEVF